MIDQPPLPPLAGLAPAMHVYADAMLREAIGIGAARWLRAGSALRCSTEVYVYDEPPATGASRVMARGDQPGCRVYFARGFRNSTWRIYSDATRPRSARRHALERVCAAGTHELGHTLGFSHAAGGVMASEQTATTVPGACVWWSRTKLPTK